MRKRMKSVPAEWTEPRAAAADSIAEFAFKKSGSKRRNSNTKSAVAKKIAEMRSHMKAGALLKVTPSELVALFYVLHSDIYGAKPAEMVGKTWETAMFAAARLIDDEFNGNSAEALLFVRWVWRREAVRESNPKRNPTSRRLTWRHMFVWKDLLTDYRVEMTRKIKSRDFCGCGDKER